MHARAIVLNDVMMQTDATRKPEAVQRRRLNGRPAWLVNTRNTSMVLCLGLHDTLQLPYWGANGQTDVPGDYVGGPGQRNEESRSVERTFIDGLPQAYPVHGDAAVIEPCLVVAREDGARGVRLDFVEDRISHPGENRGAVLELVFRDPLTGLVV